MQLRKNIVFMKIDLHIGLLSPYHAFFQNRILFENASRNFTQSDYLRKSVARRLCDIWFYVTFSKVTPYIYIGGVWGEVPPQHRHRSTTFYLTL